MNAPKNLCPEVVKLPPPAEVLPPIPALCNMVNDVLRLDYVLTCMRTPPSYNLPLPPPVYKWGPDEEDERRELLRLLCDSYTRMCFMLNDSHATDRERMLVQNNAAFVHLEKWLPPIRPHTVVKMPFPSKMDHKDYVHLFTHCHGYVESNNRHDDFIFFVRESDRDKFQQYLFEKYPQ